MNAVSNQPWSDDISQLRTWECVRLHLHAAGVTFSTLIDSAEGSRSN